MERANNSVLGQLIPVGGGDPIPLLKPKLLVGRRSRCDITLRFPNVSSHHCELELVDGYWLIRDLGSRNGTKVNGSRCKSKWLMPGDIVSIAKHRFELQYTPSGDRPPPEEEDPFALSLMEKAGLTRPKSLIPEASSDSHQYPLPPASSNNTPLPPSTGEEDQALRWLNGDSAGH